MHCNNPYDYYHKLVHYLNKKFFDIELCEEAAHIACYKAIKKNDKYDSKKGGYYSWLYRISYYAACDLLRKQMLEKKYYERNKFELITEKDEAMLETERKSRSYFLNSLFEKLDPLEKKVMILKFVYDYQNHEIAQKLRYKKHKITHIISRAKLKLKIMANSHDVNKCL